MAQFLSGEWLSFQPLRPNLREYIYVNTNIVEITDRIESVFDSAVVDNSILVLVKSKNNYIKKSKFSNKIFDGNLIERDMLLLAKNEYNSRTFSLNGIKNQKILSRFYVNAEKLGKITDSTQGITTYAKVQGEKTNWFRDKKENNYSKKVLRGREVFKYFIKWSGQYIQYGDWLWCPRNKMYFEEPKLFIRQTADRIIATYIEEPFYAIDSVHSFLVKKDSPVSLKFLLGYLNSKFASYLYNLIINEQGKVFAQVKLIKIRELPVPKPTTLNYLTFTRIELVVEKILAITKDADYVTNPPKQAKVEEYERQIDQMVYELYGLTPGEIAVVEGKVRL